MGNPSPRYTAEFKHCMDYEKLRAELDDYSSIELRHIYETQKDLYSAEEMDFMAKLIGKREGEEAALLACYLPDEIECPKCGAPNDFGRGACMYCEYEFDKSRYYERAEYLAAGGDEADFDEGDTEDSESFVFQYVISFLVPLVGYIMGAIMLTKDDVSKRAAGRMCIILALASSIVSLIGYFALLA